MKNIKYISEDNLVLIDGQPYNGDYEKPDNIWAFIWDAPDHLWIEYMDHSTAVKTQEYPSPQHITEWDKRDVMRVEAEEIEEAERLASEEEFKEKQEKTELVQSRLKTKVSLLFQAGGYELTSDEIRLLVGQPIIDDDD
jgi:hypothetical protein